MATVSYWVLLPPKATRPSIVRSSLCLNLLPKGRVVPPLGARPEAANAATCLYPENRELESGLWYHCLAQELTFDHVTSRRKRSGSPGMMLTALHRRRS